MGVLGMKLRVRLLYIPQPELRNGTSTPSKSESDVSLGWNALFCKGKLTPRSERESDFAPMGPGTIKKRHRFHFNGSGEIKEAKSLSLVCVDLYVLFTTIKGM